LTAGKTADETAPELPSSTGTNEVGGKTYESSGKRWEFSADGTYRYFIKNEGKNGPWGPLVQARIPQG
jgi:hypothetical protein